MKVFNHSHGSDQQNEDLSQFENQRQENLLSYQILDTLPEKFYDDITKLASIICGVPMALVSLSDKHRQWHKSLIGIEVREVPREISFCNQAIKQDDLYEIPNTLEDPIFFNNPFAQAPHFIQFYAGAPLKSPEGYNLGTLCVMDRQPKKLSDSQKEALVILSRSVTSQMELSRKQKELEDEKKVVEQLLDAIPLGIYLSDKSGDLVYSNKKADEIMNESGSNGELRNINCFFEKYSTSQGGSDNPFQKALLGESCYTNKTELHRDANHVPIQMWNTPIYDVNGEIKSIITAFDDITIERNIRKALEESEENFRNLIEDAGDVFYTSDPQGNFTYINSRVEKLTGHLPEELVGKHYTTLIPEEYIEETKTFYNQQFFSLTEESRLEFPILTKLGHRKWVEQTVRIKKDQKGKILQFRCVVRDTDIRKQAEQEIIRARQAAEEAKKLQERFLANMSHEIRTPMNGVLGMAHLLSETKIDDLQREYIHSILTCGNNLMVIINDILDFSKIQAGRITIEEIPFDIHDTIKNVFVSVKQKAKEKGLSLISEIDETLHQYVLGDPTRLAQILTNLIGNAIKFTHTGSVKIKVNSIEEDKSQTTLKFTVKDTGIGISENQLPLIFQDFVQASTDVTRKYGGTGLGLSIAKQLVEIQGGQISVTSEVGKGTAFTFQLAYKKSEKRALKQNLTINRSEHKNLKGIKILVAEDNIMNQMVAAHTLSRWNATVDIAVDGGEVLQKVGTGEYDLILMDLHMPVMNGDQCTTIIRHHTNPRIAQVPIIAMTASAFKSEEDRCIESGMNGYISKPFYPQDLYNQILVCMEKK